MINFHRWLVLVVLTTLSFSAMAQMPPRPDVGDDGKEQRPTKSLDMASSVAELRQWCSYPTYQTYLGFLNATVLHYPHLCRLDTVGFSLQGRLIAALVIHVPSAAKEADHQRRQVLLSGGIHGDELFPIHLLLHLVDSLLSAYGREPAITRLLDGVDVTIMPLINPDGTYYGGDNTVSMSQRYNANGVDLNRNFPDPFGAEMLDTLQHENKVFIDYINDHHFDLSANLHSGAEVLNYPWDSFTSSQRQHPYSQWWNALCARFVQTSRQYRRSIFTDVTPSGYLAGGDWYVIRNGRQDYMNYYHNINEITIEVSKTKKLSTDKFGSYWKSLAPGMIGFIGESLQLPNEVGIEHEPVVSLLRVYPNPTRDVVNIENGNNVLRINLIDRPAGVYVLNAWGSPVRVVKY